MNITVYLGAKEGNDPALKTAVQELGRWIGESGNALIYGGSRSGLMGALLVVSKQAMSGLPNLEPVSLLIILFALELPRETPGAITVFILLQGVLYGFGLWWVMYLYVWYLLALLAWLLRRMDNAFFWAVFSGLYGLCFGGLCAAVYLFAKTPAFALSWWLSGLSYDAMHGVGNFVLMLLLYRPLRRALRPHRLPHRGTGGTSRGPGRFCGIVCPAVTLKSKASPDFSDLPGKVWGCFFAIEGQRASAAVIPLSRTLCASSPFRGAFWGTAPPERGRWL